MARLAGGWSAGRIEYFGGLVKTRHLCMAAILGLLPSTVLAQAAGAPPPKADTAAQRAEVLAVVTRLFDGMRTRDTASMRGLFHPDAKLLSSSVRNGTPAVSSDPVDAWIGSIGKAPAGSVLDERLMNSVVHVEDGLAVVWTEYEFWVGDRFSHCGVDAITLGKTEGGWKLLSIADTRRRTGCKQAPAR
jgi:hypothetical protein